MDAENKVAKLPQMPSQVTLWLSIDLAKLEGDCRVADAIYAVNDVLRRVGTLKTED